MLAHVCFLYRSTVALFWVLEKMELKCKISRFLKVLAFSVSHWAAYWATLSDSCALLRPLRRARSLLSLWRGATRAWQRHWWQRGTRQWLSCTLDAQFLIPVVSLRDFGWVPFGGCGGRSDCLCWWLALSFLSTHLCLSQPVVNRKDLTSKELTKSTETYHTHFHAPTDTG
jgi:hypothetical protein